MTAKKRNPSAKNKAAAATPKAHAANKTGVPNKPAAVKEPKAPKKAAATKAPGSKKASAPKKPATAPVRTRKASAKSKAAGASSTRLRILMVTPEAHPYAKTGGLAEVSAALPAALARMGHEVTLVLPRYRGVLPGAQPSARMDLAFGPNQFSVGFVEETTADGVRSVLVDVPELFDRPGMYGEDGRDYADNALRFAVLSRGALEYARQRGERPDVIHGHDWQAGLVPVYQKMLFSGDPVVGGVPAVFTIHNLAFQGVFGRDVLAALGLGWDVYHHDALEYWGNVSLLKGGVNFSEKITTVSPSYAREILTPAFGFGLEGALRRRADDIVGILNGIDTERWNPAADGFAPAFSAEDLAGKQRAKRALLETAGLPVDDGALARPVIGIISRLTDQKGFDLVGAAAEELMALDATWVMLGSGERHYEDLWRALAITAPRSVSTTIGFSERLAHLIEAGADIFLMPSRFEPCGLNQLYSLRYGTVPVVRSTGGLDDTVVDADEPDGNGIKFAETSPAAVVAAVRRALDLYADRPRWEALQRAGMARDSSWDVSAREYVKVYGNAR